MLKYEIYTNKLLTKMKQLLGSGFELSIQTLYQNNGTKRKTVFISAKGEGFTECLPIDYYYKLYREETDIEYIAKDIISEYRRREIEKIPFQISELYDWNYIKDSIMFRLINTDANKTFLRNIPHFNICNLSQVFYLLLDVHMNYSKNILINNQFMERWNTTPEIILQQSAINTPLKLPKQFMNSKLSVSENIQDILYTQSQTELSIYFLTNSAKMYGASCIMYDGLLESIAENLNSGFFILPCSIHQVIFIPSQICNLEYAEKLKQMTKTINHEKVPEQDILSDNVYYYNRKEKNFSIIL